MDRKSIESGRQAPDPKSAPLPLFKGEMGTSCSLIANDDTISHGRKGCHPHALPQPTKVILPTTQNELGR